MCLFLQRQGLQSRKRMAPAGDTSTQAKRPRGDSSESDG